MKMYAKRGNLVIEILKTSTNKGTSYRPYIRKGNICLTMLEDMKLANLLKFLSLNYNDLINVVTDNIVNNIHYNNNSYFNVGEAFFSLQKIEDEYHIEIEDENGNTAKRITKDIFIVKKFLELFIQMDNAVVHEYKENATFEL